MFTIRHESVLCAIKNMKNPIKRNPSRSTQDQPKKPSDTWFPQPLQPPVYAVWSQDRDHPIYTHTAQSNYYLYNSTQ